MKKLFWNRKSDYDLFNIIPKVSSVEVLKPNPKKYERHRISKIRSEVNDQVIPYLIVDEIEKYIYNHTKKEYNFSITTDITIPWLAKDGTLLFTGQISVQVWKYMESVVEILKARGYHVDNYDLHKRNLLSRPINYNGLEIKVTP